MKSYLWSLVMHKTYCDNLSIRYGKTSEGKTFTVTRKAPLAGKILLTSCKCHHLIRISTTRVRTYTGKTFAVRLKIYKNRGSFPLECFAVYSNFLY